MARADKTFYERLMRMGYVALPSPDGWMEKSTSDFGLQMLVFPKPSKYGLDRVGTTNKFKKGGRISKLFIRDEGNVIARYDRGWIVKPRNAYARLLIMQVLSDVKKVAEGIKIREKPLRGMSAVMAQKINYGGEVWTRGEVAKDLQKRGFPQKAIDIFAFRGETLTEEEASRLIPKGYASGRNLRR